MKQHVRRPCIKPESVDYFPTALGRQPTFSDPSILRDILLSHHQAVVYPWEFEASFGDRILILMPTCYGLRKYFNLRAQNFVCNQFFIFIWGVSKEPDRVLDGENYLDKFLQQPLFLSPFVSERGMFQRLSILFRFCSLMPFSRIPLKTPQASSFCNLSELQFD